MRVTLRKPSLTPDDVDRVCRLWKSMDSEEKKRFIEQAVECISGLLPEGRVKELSVIAEKLMASFEAICENLERRR